MQLLPCLPAPGVLFAAASVCLVADADTWSLIAGVTTASVPDGVSVETYLRSTSVGSRGFPLGPLRRSSAAHQVSGQRLVYAP